MHKTISGVEVKDADQGTVTAVFSTFDVIDKDGDVTRHDAIKNGTPVVISAYGHESWNGRLPVGKGTIRTTPREAILEGQFFVDTTHGRDAFLTVKHLGGLQEWSYSLQNVKGRNITFEGRQVRELLSMDVKEVSPVLVGAGVGTRTTAVKTHTDRASQRLLLAVAQRHCPQLVQSWHDDQMRAFFEQHGTNREQRQHELQIGQRETTEHP